MNVIVVDINGTPHLIDRDQMPDFDVLARRSNCRCLVLASNDGNLFDPLELYADVRERDKKRGGLLWRLKSCSIACFEQYTQFLRSRNRTHYIVAQRRFRNDFQ